MGELALDGFPPISPRIPAVRSLAHIAPPPKVREALRAHIIQQQQLPRGLAEQPSELSPKEIALRSKVIANLTGADLLPVSPFLLSPTQPAGIDISRSPFFTQTSKPLPLSGDTSPLGDSSTGNTPPDGPQQSRKRRSLKSAPVSAIDQLTADLARAHAELAHVQQEYAELLNFAAVALPSAGVRKNDTAASSSKPRHVNDTEAPFERPGPRPTAELLLHSNDTAVESAGGASSDDLLGHVDVQPRKGQSDEIDELSEEAAKQKLRVSLV